MTTATIQVRAAWSGQLTGLFTIGTSAIGGSDVIGGGFGNNVYDDITDDVQDIQLFRGRSDDFAQVEQGYCRLQLTDDSGKYNKQNATGPLYGLLVPMRPLQVIADGIGQFHGYIKRIRHSPRTKTSYIEAVDFFEWLATNRPAIAEQTNKTVSYLIGLILDAVGLTDTGLRNLSGGNTIATWAAADGTKTGLALIGELVKVDRGFFFVSKAGVVTYLPRYAQHAVEAIAATFDGTMIGAIDVETDAENIVNKQTVTKTDGTAQTVSDAVSIKQFATREATREGGAISSDYLASDGEAHALAGYVVAQGRNGRPPAKQIVLRNRDAATLSQQLNRELNDYVRVMEPEGDTDFNGRIQSVGQHFWDGFAFIETTFTIQEQVLTFFTIGSSTIGGSHVVGY